MRAARTRLGLDPTGGCSSPSGGPSRAWASSSSFERSAFSGPTTSCLAVVGGGLLTDELRRLSSQLGLDGRVRFVGRVAEDELLDWYRAADLFVLPTVAYEGFGMVTVEALASGTPVVGTPAGATPELLEPLDRGSSREARTLTRWRPRSAMSLVFADDDFRARCREYALARFDWDRGHADLGRGARTECRAPSLSGLLRGRIKLSGSLASAELSSLEP